jgi:hypothetical protein
VRARAGHGSGGTGRHGAPRGLQGVCACVSGGRPPRGRRPTRGALTPSAVAVVSCSRSRQPVCPPVSLLCTCHAYAHGSNAASDPAALLADSIGQSVARLRSPAHRRLHGGRPACQSRARAEVPGPGRQAAARLHADAIGRRRGRPDAAREVPRAFEPAECAMVAARPGVSLRMVDRGSPADPCWVSPEAVGPEAGPTARACR